MRRLYEQRRRILVEVIDRELGDAFELIGAEAGMHLTLLARRPLRDAATAAQAARHRLWLAALPLACAGANPRQEFVLGFGNTRAAEVPAAVRLLKELVRG